jgi:hypothetical protein
MLSGRECGLNAIGKANFGGACTDTTGTATSLGLLNRWWLSGLYQSRLMEANEFYPKPWWVVPFSKEFAFNEKKRH